MTLQKSTYTNENFVPFEKVFADTCFGSGVVGLFLTQVRDYFPPYNLLFSRTLHVSDSNTYSVLDVVSDELNVVFSNTVIPFVRM